MQNEVWKPIQGFEGIYEVSNFGRIKSLSRIVIGGKGKMQQVTEKILANTTDKKGYLVVRLCDSVNKKSGTFKVHRLVASAFILNKGNKQQVNHINAVKSDNRVENLEWVTPQENIEHSVINGLQDYDSKRIAINVYKNGLFVETLKGINTVAKKLRIGKNSIYSVLLNQKPKHKDYSFSYATQIN
jgi:predicted transcriptional regulator YheO